jgi:hypothetical protein
MAQYTFYCFACSTPREVKLSFSEHDVMKNSMFCDCGGKLIQKVEPPFFKLGGLGWYGDNGYSLSQMEVDGNLEQEKRFEAQVYDDQGKERNIKEI